MPLVERLIGAPDEEAAAPSCSPRVALEGCAPRTMRALRPSLLAATSSYPKLASYQSTHHSAVKPTTTLQLARHDEHRRPDRLQHPRHSSYDALEPSQTVANAHGENGALPDFVGAPAGERVRIVHNLGDTTRHAQRDLPFDGAMITDVEPMVPDEDRAAERRAEAVDRDVFDWTPHEHGDNGVSGLVNRRPPALVVCHDGWTSKARF